MTALAETSEDVVRQRLRTFRTARGMSQQLVAERMQALGRTAWRQPTVFKVESGQRPIFLDDVAALAVVFEVTLADLLGVGERRLWGVKTAYTCGRCEEFATRSWALLVAHVGSHDEEGEPS